MIDIQCGNCESFMSLDSSAVLKRVKENGNQSITCPSCLTRAPRELTAQIIFLLEAVKDSDWKVGTQFPKEHNN